MRCHSFGLVVASSFWRELLSGKIFEEQICITLTDFRMTEVQSMLDFILEGTINVGKNERLRLVDITRNFLPDFKMVEEGNSCAYMTNAINEPNHDLNLTCKTCFKYFVSKKECDDHTERMHIKKEEYERCSICQRKFKTRTALESHIKSIHTEHMKEDYICLTCGSRYGYERDLR